MVLATIHLTRLTALFIAGDVISIWGNKMKEPNYAPMYAAMYPGLAGIARKHGYALAVHGTLARDMDLICIPWVAQPSEPQTVVDEITKEFAIRQVGELGKKEHGRIAWTISVGFGDCFIDLSFMPCSGNPDNHFREATK